MSIKGISDIHCHIVPGVDDGATDIGETVKLLRMEYEQGVRILSGPLMGMEGNIRRIDRHKRIAYLEIEMFGRTVEMKVGLEIIRKE